MRACINGQQTAHLLRRLENDEVAQRAAWPQAIHSPRCTVPQPEMLYAWIFNADVPSVSTDDMRCVALLCKYLDDQHAVLDAATIERAQAQRIAALQFECGALLAQLLRGNDAMWDSVRDDISLWHWSCAEGARPMSARAHLLSRDANDAVRIACGRSVSARIAARVLHARNGTSADQLLRSIDAFFAAQSLLESLRTWPSDLLAHRITPLTVELRASEAGMFAAAIDGAIPPGDLMPVVFGRVAEPLMLRALTYCEESHREASDALREGTWGAMIEELRAYLLGVLTDIRSITSVPA